MDSRNTKKIPNPKPGETIMRMYRQGLGDCFLITFRGDTGKPVNVLIDCGVWDNDKTTVDRMKRVIGDINIATGGDRNDDPKKSKLGHLDLLICTHEHWDHNSGFLQRDDIFGNMQIDNVWLAWTENPKDPLGRSLKNEYDARRKKLKNAINRLEAADPTMRARAAAMGRIDGIFAADRPANGGVPADPAKAMNWIRDLANRHPDESFLMPGNVRSIPGAAKTARAYVLGPPYSRTLLRQNLPTKKQQKEGEVYSDSDAFHMLFANRLADDAFFAAVDHHGKSQEAIAILVGEELDDYQLGLPFDVAQQITASAARQRSRSYFDPEQQWRRIDNDWLDTAAQLALWMQSSTNNTSLVLAIEVLPAGKVLLMAADAQVGNWISWKDVKFDAPFQKMTSESLLERTVLYKVGHHGSHNATLRKDGLEKMTSDELMAFIPVNRASVEKKGWAMPYPPMYRALRDATSGRVIRADEGAKAPPKAFKFVKNDLYFEVTVRS